MEAVQTPPVKANAKQNLLDKIKSTSETIKEKATDFVEIEKGNLVEEKLKLELNPPEEIEVPEGTKNNDGTPRKAYSPRKPRPTGKGSRGSYKKTGKNATPDDIKDAGNERTAIDPTASLINGLAIAPGAVYFKKNVDDCMLNKDQIEVLASVKPLPPEGEEEERSWGKYLITSVAFIIENLMKARPAAVLKHQQPEKKTQDAELLKINYCLNCGAHPVIFNPGNLCSGCGMKY
jgi:hypothetical protein